MLTLLDCALQQQVWPLRCVLPGGTEHECRGERPQHLLRGARDGPVSLHRGCSGQAGSDCGSEAVLSHSGLIGWELLSFPDVGSEVLKLNSAGGAHAAWLCIPAWSTALPCVPVVHVGGQVGLGYALLCHRLGGGSLPYLVVTLLCSCGSSSLFQESPTHEWVKV